MNLRLINALLSFLLFSVALGAQEFTHPTTTPPGDKSKYEYKYDPNNGNPHPVRVEKKVGNSWVPVTEASKPANVEEWKWERLSGNVIRITFGGNPSQGDSYRIVSDRDPNTPTPGTTGDTWKSSRKP